MVHDCDDSPPPSPWLGRSFFDEYQPRPWEPLVPSYSGQDESGTLGTEYDTVIWGGYDGRRSMQFRTEFERTSSQAPEPLSLTQAVLANADTGTSRASLIRLEMRLMRASDSLRQLTGDPGPSTTQWFKFETIVEGEEGYYSQLSATPTAYGGFSDIFQCNALLPDGSFTLVAVKRLRAVKMPRSLDMRQIDSKLQKRLKREVKIWAALRHQNIVPLIGFSLYGEVCLLSPWFVNGNVAVYLEANPGVDRMKLVRHVAAGVSYLHGRDPVVVHGDLKPDNVLIDSDGVPKLIDFGLSKMVEEEDEVTAISSTSLRDTGNIRWMAPELLLEDGVTRSRSTDTFSFGCMALFIVTGDVPFKGTSDRTLHLARYNGAQPVPDDVNYSGLQEADLMNVLLSCWKVHPSERPTMFNVVQRLNCLISSSLESDADALD